MKPWQRSALYLCGGYVGLVLMLMALENKLLYHPAGDSVPPPDASIEDVEFTSADGTRIHAWWRPLNNADVALLYAHGNAGNLSHRGNSIVRLGDRLNASVLIFDYPGYGKSDGSPSERGCYAAADAAYDWLTETQKIPPKKIILYGGSLGGGIATDLASRKDHRALILIKTFTSAPDAACSVFWWLPVPIRSVMTNRFDNIGKIGECRRPIFLAHGTTDEVVPHEHSVRLFEAAHEPKRFVSIPGNRHNDPLPEEVFTSLKEFLDQHPVE